MEITDIKQVYDLLAQLKNSIGMWAVIVMIVVVILMICTWHFAKARIKKIAEQSFNQELAKFKSKLYDDIGNKLLEKNQSLSSDLEKIKNDLSIIKSAEIDLIKEEKNAIIEYNKSFTEWEETISRLPKNLDTHNLCDLAYEKQELAYNKMQRAYAQLELFIRDTSLLQTFIKLKKEFLLKGPSILFQCLNQIKLANAKRDSSLIDSTEYWEERTSINRIYSDDVVKLYEETNELYTKCTDEMRKQLGVDSRGIETETST